MGEHWPCPQAKQLLAGRKQCWAGATRIHLHCSPSLPPNCRAGAKPRASSSLPTATAPTLAQPPSSANPAACQHLQQCTHRQAAACSPCRLGSASARTPLPPVARPAPLQPPPAAQQGGAMSKAKAVTATIRLVIPAGQAKPSPPVGPALGQAGLKIMDFCKDFNAKTADFKVGGGAASGWGAGGGGAAGRECMRCLCRRGRALALRRRRSLTCTSLPRSLPSFCRTRCPCPWSSPRTRTKPSSGS